MPEEPNVIGEIKITVTDKDFDLTHSESLSFVEVVFWLEAVKDMMLSQMNRVSSGD